MTDIKPDPVAQALREGAAQVAAQTTTPPWPLVAERQARRNKQRLRRISLATGAVLAAAAITVAFAVLPSAGRYRPRAEAHPVRFGNHILMVRDLLAAQKAATPVPRARVVTRALQVKTPNYASLAFGAGSAWVLSPAGSQTGSSCGKLVRVNTATLNATGSIPFRLCPSAVAYGDGAVWVLSFQIGARGYQVARVDPATLGVAFVTTVDESITPAGDTGAKYMFLTVADGKVFAAVQSRLGGAQITALDATSGKPVYSATLPSSYGPLTALAANDKGVWAGTFDGWVLRLDPHTDSIRTAQHLGTRVASLSASSTGIWVSVNLPVPSRAIYPGLDILRLSPSTGSLKDDTGLPMTFVAANGSDVWALSSAPPYTSDAGLVAQINPANGAITKKAHLTAPTAQAPDTIGVYQGTVWVLNDFLDTITRIAP
jgi:outer membrane protein assembly factor BamB